MFLIYTPVLITPYRNFFLSFSQVDRKFSESANKVFFIVISQDLRPRAWYMVDSQYLLNE